MDHHQDTSAGDTSAGAAVKPAVKHFRQILFWPVHLVAPHGKTAHDHAQAFADLGPNNPWAAVEDEFTGNPSEFQERHYSEFVTFLPPVQRFLYGHGAGAHGKATCGNNPIKVMRRSDISALRVTLKPGATPVDLKIAHVDLYFFYDIDVAILALEFFANDLSLATTQDILYRLGRIYPAFWHADGSPGHCAAKTEWLDKDGRVLASSDFEDRPSYLAHVCKFRSARIGAHWEFLLKPLVPSDRHSPQLSYRLLEYQRLPLMAFVAFDDADRATRADYVRLAHANAADMSTDHLKGQHLDDFETKHCYNRYHEKRDPSDWPSTRYMACGHTLVVSGDARNSFFVNADHGLLNSFRHQHFMLCLIAHFHKAALLMFSDRLAEAVNRLDVTDPQAVMAFRATTRQALETFLRFTHRYWYHVVSNQEQSHDLFELCRSHLELDCLYEDVRQEVQEMSQFLENEAMRRQNESVSRLTVVTTFGLIGTVATGFLGMNVFDHTALAPAAKIAIFLFVFVPVMVLTFFTVAKSARLTEFLDALSTESATTRDKLRAFMRVWWR